MEQLHVILNTLGYPSGQSLVELRDLPLASCLPPSTHYSSTSSLHTLLYSYFTTPSSQGDVHEVDGQPLDSGISGLTSNQRQKMLHIDAMCDFLTRVLSLNPSHRLSAKLALENKYFKLVATEDPASLPRIMLSNPTKGHEFSAKFDGEALMSASKVDHGDVSNGWDSLGNNGNGGHSHRDRLGGVGVEVGASRKYMNADASGDIGGMMSSSNSSDLHSDSYGHRRKRQSRFSNTHVAHDLNSNLLGNGGNGYTGMPMHVGVGHANSVLQNKVPTQIAPSLCFSQLNTQDCVYPAQKTLANAFVMESLPQYGIESAHRPQHQHAHQRARKGDNNRGRYEKYDGKYESKYKATASSSDGSAGGRGERGGAIGVDDVWGWGALSSASTITSSSRTHNRHSNSSPRPNLDRYAHSTHSRREHGEYTRSTKNHPHRSNSKYDRT